MDRGAEMTPEPGPGATPADDRKPGGRRPAFARRAVVFLVRLAVGGAFVYAGWQKAFNPEQFIRDIWGFRLVPEEWAYWIAAYLPFLELFAGLALVTGLQRRGAHVLLGGMLVAFLGALVSAWARGLDVECGCFGASAPGAGLGWPIARDLLMVAGVLVSVWGSRIAVAARMRVAWFAPNGGVVGQPACGRSERREQAR